MLDRNLHKSILVQIIREIYTDSSLGPLLGFKGGTAAMLFYDLNRFSVDLDFDLLDEKKKDEVFKKVGKIVSKFGEIKEQRDKQYNLIFVLSYEAAAPNVKVEINKRSFGSKYKIKNYLGIPMLVMTEEDMFANKLVAMTERRKVANRDIFDVWFFSKNNWGINRKLVEQRVDMSYKDYLKKCVKFIENFDNKYILSGMGDLMEPSMKDWARDKLIEDTLFLLKLRLENEK